MDGIDSNAVAITGNLTATNVTGGGYAYIAPIATTQVTTSALNIPTGDTRANGFVGLLASDQSIAVGYQASAGHADLILDLTGYFVAPPAPMASASFTSPAPGTSTDVFTTGEDVTWTETGTIRSIALSQYWAVPTGDGCTSTWNVATTITSTTTDQVYSNYVQGRCYRYSITLNGDPSTTVYSGATRDPAPAAKIPVLEYHRISPTIDPGSTLPGLVVDPATFDAQMKALHDGGWRTITAADLGHRMATHAFIPDKTFVVTIDDGRDDGYFYAYPILKKYGFVATYYLITSRGGPYITWPEAAEMVTNGMEIADHTVDHDDVTTLNASDLAYEIGAAKTTIETQLAALGVTETVTTFAYPFGTYNAAAESYLSSHGFTAAFTENPGAVRPGMNVEVLPRVYVSRGESAATLLSAIASS